MLVALHAACGGSQAADTAPAPALRHGDLVTLPGAFGTQDVTRTFLGGAGGPIETLSAGSPMPDGGGWLFNDLGGPTTVALDGQRGGRRAGSAAAP